LRVNVASRPIVSFWSESSTSSGDYGWLLVYLWYMHQRSHCYDLETSTGTDIYSGL
jgi:hypothetical protein